MNNQRSFMILFVTLSSACTGGVVIKNGSPVANATLTFYTNPCRETAGLALPPTGVSGQFSSNPFSSSSSIIDYTKKVPTGRVYVKLASPAGTYWRTLDHAYDQSCNVAYNGATSAAPCRGYIFEVSEGYGTGGLLTFDSTYNAFRLVFTQYDTAGTRWEIQNEIAVRAVVGNFGNSKDKCTPIID